MDDSTIRKLQARAATNLSPSTAAALGVSLHTLMQFSGGKRNLDPQQLQRVRMFYGLDERGNYPLAHAHRRMG